MLMLQLLLACQFLTIVPLTRGTHPSGGCPGGSGEVGEKDLAAAMAWFPLVGLLLGAAAAGVYMLTRLVSVSLLNAFVPLAFLVVITGNMHGDGLMDMADGLGSGRPADQALAIMKDSHVGAHGVMAGILSFLAKLVFLGALMPRDQITALVLMPALGRWAQVYAARTNPYVRPVGGKGGFTRHVGNREVVLASVTLAPAIAVLGPKGAVLAVVVYAVTHWAGCYVRKRIGGMTGDTLGALSELAEIVGLAVILVLEKF